MQQERYKLYFSKRFLTADFISHGPKGAIHKRIVFEKTDLPNFYNLAFGDKYFDRNDFDDTAISNNGDTQIILATVVHAIELFTKTYYNAWIYAKGSSAVRNRLYQMGINKYLDSIRSQFEIIAETEESWETYTKGKNYLAFAVRRKF